MINLKPIRVAAFATGAIILILSIIAFGCTQVDRVGIAAGATKAGIDALFEKMETMPTTEGSWKAEAITAAAMGVAYLLRKRFPPMGKR